MVTVGIDPGISGAIAIIYGKDEGRKLEDMPVMAGTGKRQTVNGSALARLMPLGNDVTCYLEQVAAMPGQGVSSMFSFGTSYGIVLGVMAAFGIPVVLVTPQAWKKHFNLIGKDKDMARALAQRLYPSASLGRKKDIGRADALLIARYGMEKSK